MENEQSAGNLGHSDSLAATVGLPTWPWARAWPKGPLGPAGPAGYGLVEPQELSKLIATYPARFQHAYLTLTTSGTEGYGVWSSLGGSTCINSYISDHMSKHVRPETDEEFGYYLAGLIEGDGWFGNNRFEIAFANEDTFLAYFIKKKIGYGSVLNLKGPKKNSVRYVLRHSEGLKRVLRLVNGKFLGNYKINQLLKHGYDIKFNTAILPPANFDLNSNYWLSGFSDADGSFVINIPSTPASRPYPAGPKGPLALWAFEGQVEVGRALPKVRSEAPLFPITHQKNPAGLPTPSRPCSTSGCEKNPQPAVSYPFRPQELTQRELVFGYKIKQGRIHNFISPVRSGPERSRSGLGRLAAAHSPVPFGSGAGILKTIQEFFGGNIYFLDREQVFYYNSASYAPNVAVFNYFDKFQLNSSKLIRYLKWRQAYRIVQRKEHLTEKGLNKIRKLQGNLRD
jgi:LAGLIDADG DNA endonuclease family protein